MAKRRSISPFLPGQIPFDQLSQIDPRALGVEQMSPADALDPNIFQPGSTNPADYYEADPQLDQLRDMYRQRMMRSSAMGDDEGPIPGVLANIMDANAAAQQGQANAASILSGYGVKSVTPGGNVAAMEKAKALRRQKALGEVSMFKNLEDLAKKRRERSEDMAGKSQDRYLKALYYRASLGDKEAQRQFQEAMTGTKIGAQFGILGQQQEFKATESEKDRAFKAGESAKARAAKAKKGGGDQFKALPKEAQVTVTKLAENNAAKTAIANSLKSSIEEINREKNEEIKIKMAEGILKTLNSTEGKDAIGVDEAKRLGSLLQFKFFNLIEPGSFFGRDLDLFIKQVGNTVGAIENGIKQNQKTINDQYTAAGKNPPNRIGFSESKYNPSEQTRIIKGAKYRKVEGGWQKIK